MGEHLDARATGSVEAPGEPIGQPEHTTGHTDQPTEEKNPRAKKTVSATGSTRRVTFKELSRLTFEQAEEAHRYALIDDDLWGEYCWRWRQTVRFSSLGKVEAEAWARKNGKVKGRRTQGA